MKFFQFQIGRAALLRGLDFGRRSSAALPLIAISFFAVAATAQTNGLSDAEIQGQQLAQRIIEQQPSENFTNIGALKIRNKDGETTTLHLTIITTILAAGYQTDYQVGTNVNDSSIERLTIFSAIGHSKIYYSSRHAKKMEESDASSEALWRAKEIMVPLAGSDFWICDLGLEFFHWPEQKIIKKEFARGRGCMVLESTNPNPSSNGYSKVDCWIDEETLGIVHAEAFDANGKLLKIFDPKSFKKVNGQWELQDMEIRNVQTGSRSRIEFDLTATNSPEK